MDMLNPWLSLPTDWQSQTDEKLGWWLVATWIGFQAEKRGIRREAIPHEFAENLIRASAEMDSDSIKNAPLESAFRKACKGDMAAAGRMVREYVKVSAHGMVAAKYAQTGIRHAAARKRAGRKTGKQRKDAAKELHDKILRDADELVRSGKRDPRSVASVLAKRAGNPSPSTIRRILAKAKIKTRTS